MRAGRYFLETCPASRRPSYSRHRGEIQTRVAIVGGGLTGCACAAAFAAAGVACVVLEADRIGSGATAAASGLLRHDPDASFREACERHGLRASRHIWQGFRRAGRDLAAAIRRLRIRADLAPQDLLWFARSSDAGLRALQREYQARRDGGVDAAWLTARAFSSETHAEGGGAIRTKGEALDPYRACAGLAAAAAARGAAIFERTPVRRVRARRKHVEISTGGGSIIADHVVIASGALIDDLRALRRHFAPALSYAVVTDRLPAAVRRELGGRASALRDDHAPPRLLRWLDDRVLFAGATQKPIAERLREKALVPQAHELMYELTTVYPAISGVQPEWAWDAVAYGSPDGLPVIGPHRNFPRHLFALGLANHGPAAAWLAARVLLRAYLQAPVTGDELFGFARVL